MSTLRAEVAAALRRAARYDADHIAAPAAVLWPDPDRLWEQVVDQVQEAVPVLVLGERDATAARGPAIWIRAVLACAQDADAPDVVALPAHLASHDGANPWVVYLPGVSRDEVLAATGATHPLAPLVEPAHRSVWWHNAGQPWTPSSFLRGKDGLGLDLAQDADTRAALGEALRTLMSQDVDDLRSHGRLDATRLRDLLLPDPVRDVLAWIDDPEATRTRLGATWPTFVAQCTQHYGFSPTKQTPITAAGLLGRRGGAWTAVWTRFTEAPRRYPHLPAVLDKAAPAPTLFGDTDDPHPDSWPSRNDAQEAALRVDLVALATQPTPAAARGRVAALAAEHGGRMGSVWDDLGRAPLARAVVALRRLTELVAATPPHDLTGMTGWYATTGWQVDDLALRTLAEAATSADADAARAALAAVYDPWLDQTATAFQASTQAGYPAAIGLDVEPGTCVVYVDALRLDLARRLAARLDAEGLAADLSHRLAAVPTVTPTGQPAVAPLTTTLAGGPDFCAADPQGHPVRGAVLHHLLADTGVQVLPWSQTGDPSGVAWTATNSIDEYGHTHDHGLARAVDGQLDRVRERVDQLLAAGWQRVVVVTDHGWLLPANPARKVELPLHLTEGSARKPRVARLAAGNASTFPTVPWTWDATVSMVSAPGASAFEAGTLYEHGGLSLQECVIPVLTVTRSSSAAEAAIEALKWTGLRCRVDVRHPRPGLTVEVRLAAADPATAIGGPRPVADDEAKVLVPDDAHEGADAYVVLLDDGTVIDQRPTRIGGGA